MNSVILAVPPRALAAASIACATVNLSSRTYITVTKPVHSSSTYDQLTGTIQQFFQAIVNDASADVYDKFEDLIT